MNVCAMCYIYRQMFARMTLMQITQVYDDGMSEKKCATYQLLDTPLGEWK